MELNVTTNFERLSFDDKCMAYLETGPVSIADACALNLVGMLARLSKRGICHFQGGAYHKARLFCGAR